MKQFFLVFVLVVSAASAVFAQTTPAPTALLWEKSVVRVEVTRRVYDYYQPWSTRTAQAAKIGLVVTDNQILTTSQDLSDRTLVRVQKGGRGPWVSASVAWVDYYANLALLTIADAEFRADLRPVKFADKPASEGAALQILRWREGKLEIRQAEFTQFTTSKSQFSDINHVQMEVASDIQSAGQGEPIVANSHVVGLVADQTGRTCEVIPASFVSMILEARRAGNQRGLGYFHFFWQPAENPASLANLKLPGAPRGVLVIDVPERLDGGAPVFKPHDIILQIDGFDIDTEGDYLDPDYGQLMLENLATRGRWAGDDVEIKIWRDGQAQDITYRLPKYEFAHSLVPQGVYDQPPDYLIVGGLVFQPLVVPYLQRWGNDWQRTAPFRLNYYREDEATKDNPSLVILSQVLPDRFNIGYQEQRWFVVNQVNDRRITTLADLSEALKQPQGEFHVIDFTPNDSLQRIVLAAGEPERDATKRVLERFSISTAVQITPKNAAAN
jgi:S1-C subfamily serine protease